MRVRLSALFISTMTLLGCGEDVVDLEVEEAAVRAAWEELNEAFEAADWDRYEEYWVHDEALRVVHPAARDWIAGWAEFEGRYRPLVAAGSEWDFETTRLDITVDPTGDTAWLLVQMVLTFNGQAQEAWQMASLRKTEGRWRFAGAFSASLSPQDAGGA